MTNESAIKATNAALALARTRPFGDRPNMTHGEVAIESLKQQGYRIVKTRQTDWALMRGTTAEPGSPPDGEPLFVVVDEL